MNYILRRIEQEIDRLNDRQQSSVEAILRGWEGAGGEFILPVIEGPPGTGKTHVAVLAASRCLLESRRPQIAYLTYTHFAAERAREAFANFGFTSNEVVRITPDPETQDWQRGIVGCREDLTPLTPNEQRRLRNTPILISTLHSSGRVFSLQTHSLIIIDEFSQVSPPLFFSTLSKVRRAERNPSGYVLVGDPNQLPIITSQPLLRPNIGIYLFSRKRYQPHQLNVQYRMHERICQAVNALRAALNSYPLDTDEGVRHRTLIELGYRWDGNRCPSEFQRLLSPDYPCVFINTDNLPGMEDVSLGGSKYFTSEALLAARLACSLAQSYADQHDDSLLPTILSPYDAQIGAISGYLENPSLQERCITIYKAQGREYPCTIISFGRKNPYRWIGFLGEPELRAQTYVACSRAMAKLIILFSFSTFQGHRDYDILLNECRKVSLIVDAERSWLSG